ncbi:MAG: pyridoxal phosphate-dependent aminotransferase [Cyclobacteriaceae bacterium]|nr:pyridoxal phosphate-dependent aminotransferase [Cyclobacteriaceae bacterium]
MISDRVLNMEESATLAMAAKARSLKEQGKDVISLSLGEPDFKTPLHICEGAKKAIDEGKYFAYPPVAGYNDLREAIAKKLREENNIKEAEAKHIAVSNGAKQSIANIMFSLINPGDEVIIFSPYWVSYSALVELPGGVPVFVKGTLETEFKVTAQQVEEAITPKTKAILYSSPCNPTGAVFLEEELRAIADVVKKHENLLVLADEIYEHINYTGSHFSIASIEGMFDKTVTINGFAKGFAMTGWRVGYICAPEWVVKACMKIQGQITSANSSISQRAALTALREDLAPTWEMAKAYKNRRDIVSKLLSDIPGVKANQPQGAFYFFPDVSYFFGKSDGDITIANASDLCLYILDKSHVSLVEGGAFGEPNCIRISYAASEEELREALKRMKEVLGRLS